MRVGIGGQPKLGHAVKRLGGVDSGDRSNASIVWVAERVLCIIEYDFV